MFTCSASHVSLLEGTIHNKESTCIEGNFPTKTSLNFIPSTPKPMKNRFLIFVTAKKRKLLSPAKPSWSIVLEKLGTFFYSKKKNTWKWVPRKKLRPHLPCKLMELVQMIHVLLEKYSHGPLCGGRFVHFRGRLVFLPQKEVYKRLVFQLPTCGNFQVLCLVSLGGRPWGPEI